MTRYERTSLRHTHFQKGAESYDSMFVTFEIYDTLILLLNRKRRLARGVKVAVVT